MLQTTKDGTTYDGDWANNFRDGYGVITVPGPDGTRVKQYVGTFKGGRKWVRLLAYCFALSWSLFKCLACSQY